MLSARIELRGEELFCADTGEGGASDGAAADARGARAPARLGRELRRGGAVSRDVDRCWSRSGEDMAAFLDDGDRWLGRVVGGTIGEIALDIGVPGTAGGAGAGPSRSRRFPRH